MSADSLYLPRYPHLLVLILLLIGPAHTALCQAAYKMGNNRVYNCRGKLTDSDANKQAAKKYANGEDFIFTVCVRGASSINVKFNGSVCIELSSDYLKVYSGNDTSGPLLKTYSGTINNPSPFNCNDSCLTFYFHSDQNIVCDGWDLDWEAKITSVPQPKFSAIVNPTCNSTKIRVQLDQDFNCDSVKAANFTLTGALGTAISSVTAVNCNSRNESSTFDITFASGLNKSGNYVLDFNSAFRDPCDSVWKINAKLKFKITDCPISVKLFANKYVLCKGSCATLTSIVTGGNSSNYVYNWLSGGLAGAAPKAACPLADTRYILQVTDGVSVPGSDTVDIIVIEPPVAQKDTTVCQSGGAFRLSASPPGGSWSGRGITDISAGTFNPGVAGAGNIKVFYSSGACRDSVLITVKAINAGPPVAACPATGPFMVSGSPAGGNWSGPNISVAGLVTPPVSPGSFKVTYTWNGCTSDKTINIDSIVIKRLDTVCQSRLLDTFRFYPLGGLWTGPGLIDNAAGINSPSTAGPGNKKYIYSISGCRDTLARTINSVDAGWDEIACPDAGQRTLPAGLPSGGYWTGTGILDPVNGIFDADSFRVPGRSTFAQVNLTYHATNGCLDDKIMYLRYTRFYTDTVSNCVSDTAYFMRYQYLLNDPWNMTFTGSKGIAGSGLYYQKFDPALAGRGSYNQVIGEANGCYDTVIIRVYPRADIQRDTTVCVADASFALYNNDSTGVFGGPGITNIYTGVFDPRLAGPGLHIVLYYVPGRCPDTVKVTVKPLPSVTLSGLKPGYCMRDTLISLIVSPRGGSYGGSGLIDSAFNPSLAGTGSHTITYTYGTGNCVSQASALVTVGDTLQMDLSGNKDTICRGTTVALQADAHGGTGAYDLRWSSGQHNVQAIYEAPKTTTLYRLVLKDGCSDSVEKTYQVYVHEPMYGDITTSLAQCNGNLGFADLRMRGTGPFSYLWNTVPPQNTLRISAPVGNMYKVHVANTMTGCTYDTTATIPGYGMIRAYFATSPAGQCVYSNNALVRIINLSEGGTYGSWDFGDGAVLPYDPLQNPSHKYLGDTDSYTIRLVIENDGHCRDSFRVDVCVLDTISLFIPTAFTPNDDGRNDVFMINSSSVTEATIEIYNRWGEKVFFTDDPRQGWDGFYRGKICPSDYYVYTIKYKGKKTPWKFARGYFYLLM